MRNLLALCLFLLILAGCMRGPVAPYNEPCDVNPDLRQSLIGTWETMGMVIGIDTINNSETSVVLEVTPGSWNEKVKTQPARCRFNSDGTYASWIYDLNNHLFRKTTGQWNLAGHYLSLVQSFPSEKKIIWQVNLKNFYAEFLARYDFDGDGKSDDRIYCQMKKISSGNYF